MRNRLFLAFLITCLDQVSKLWAMSGGQRYVFSFFNVIHTRNSGLTFGLLPGIAPWLIWFAMGLVVSYVVWELFHAYNRIARIAYSFILGGAVGNLIDRVRYGYVIDFIDIHWGPYHYPWPFNVADAFIILGILMIIFGLNKK